MPTPFLQYIESGLEMFSSLYTSRRSLLVTFVSHCCQATIESKSVFVSERGLTSVQWTEYSEHTKRVQYSTVPTSSITAEVVMVDGFALSQKDTAGVVTTFTRSYTVNGMVLTQTDGRGNTTTTVADKAGRALMVTDAAGNVTTTVYCDCCDQPATITDAQGNTTCYRYDERGRKVAEWGTGIQPVTFGYDDAGRLVSLTTYRNPDVVLSTDPGELTGDVTTWTYDPATGLELSKTYADGTAVVKTYDAHNRLVTETNARGKMKCHSYEHARGLLLGTTYYHSPQDGEEPVTDSLTPARSYAYNHLGQLTQVIDAAGVRTLAYNSYGEQESDSLVVDGDTHLITETRDAQGRSTGYVYSKNGASQQTVSTGYGTDGRIATAGFVHGGSEKQFSYEYLPGTHLLQKLTKPNGMSLTQSYEPQRDLLTGMAYHRGSTLVAQRAYTYDTLGRPLSRSTARNGQTVNDTFGYNNRSELTTATVNGGSYAYDYDNIGNRLSSQSSAGAEADAAVVEYAANELNQYTALAVDGVTDFQPEYDADGNQTRVKTSTGIWAISYDTENRPTDFTSMAADNTITTVHCEYDSMGRRAIKRVMVNGNVTLHQRYIYRGYLQIACIDLTRSHHPALWYITWDPTQNIATRPLALQKDGTWYTYGWDLTKNICEVYSSSGYIRSSYTYSPYGQVSASGAIEQPIQWSSEFNDTELGLIYYNYRHYNPVDGRWIGRDIIFQEDELNMYSIVQNTPVSHSDELGKQTSKTACCNRYLPKPQEAIFIYPYRVQGMELLGFVTMDDINAFYKAIHNLNKITKNNKRCYYARVYQKGAATVSMVQQLQRKCDITYLIGHGIKLDGKDYVEMKDGRICVNDLNVKGKICKGFGCYIGNNSTIVSQSGTLNKLTRELMSLAMSDRCPGFNICVFSGPVNSRI